MWPLRLHNCPPLIYTVHFCSLTRHLSSICSLYQPQTKPWSIVERIRFLDASIFHPKQRFYNKNTGNYKEYANFAWGWALASSKPIHINPLFIHGCICMQQWCCARAWAVQRKASIISATHVFEEVEVFLLSVKQDLLGLHFIADSVSA